MEQQNWNFAVTGSKRLAWQQGDRALFAEIAVTIRPMPGESLQIMLPADLDQTWRYGIQFGAACFMEAFAHRHSAVTESVFEVEAVMTMPCDTTACSLSYVTFHALCAAFGFEGEELFAFDPATGIFQLNT